MTVKFVKLKAAFLALVSLSVAAGASNLAPHRAIYDLKSAEVSDKAPFNSANGRMAYEMQGSECEGWSISYRIANRYSNRDGTENVYDTQATSWEAADGTEFRYNQKFFTDNALTSEYKITVKRKDGKTESEGVIVSPVEAKFKLPPDTLFTMGHQARVLELARNGKNRDSALVFDGSDNDKTYRIISFIGKEKSNLDLPKEAKVQGGDGLAKMKNWPVTMSYYPADNEQADEPTYQSTLNILDNGVTSSVDVKYNTHTVRGTLTSLEMLPQQDCK